MAKRKMNLDLPQQIEELRAAYRELPVPSTLSGRICAAARLKERERSWRWIPVVSGGLVVAVALLVIQVRLSFRQELTAWNSGVPSSIESPVPPLSMVSVPSLSEIYTGEPMPFLPASSEIDVPSLREIELSQTTLGI